jgi:hypothetical protein
MQESTWGERIRTAAIAVLVFIVLPSHALHFYSGVESKTLFSASVPAILLLTVGSLRLRNPGKLILVLSSLLVLTAMASLWSTLMSQAFLGLTLSAVIAITWLTTDSSFKSGAVKFLYWFNVVLLVGSWIGFFYSLAGGGPSTCFQNPDKTTNCLYLATFGRADSNSAWATVRPTGIFDEPGALSFFTILVICMNELRGDGKKKSITLFLLGLVTFSVAHAICFAAYLSVVFKKRIAYLALAGVILIQPVGNFLVENFGSTAPIITQFFDRFSIADGGIKGDNRTSQVVEFFSLVDQDITQYGHNALAKYKSRSITVVDQSSNPFSIWFGYGVIMWIPYVILLVVLIRNAFERKSSVKVTAILLSLLLLQRPYIYTLYWSFAIWSTIVLMYVTRAEAEGQPV